jgi:hypothetical protein
MLEKTEDERRVDLLESKIHGGDVEPLARELEQEPQGVRTRGRTNRSKTAS